MIAILELGEATAEGVAERTGRLKTAESVYLNWLERMGFVKKHRQGRTVHFSPTELDSSDCVGKRVIVRVDVDLLDSYREKHPELKGLTYSALTDIILRKSVKEGTSEKDEGKTLEINGKNSGEKAIENGKNKEHIGQTARNECVKTLSKCIHATDDVAA